MTFDLEAAREICDIRKHVAETGCYDAKADCHLESSPHM